MALILTSVIYFIGCPATVWHFVLEFWNYGYFFELYYTTINSVGFLVFSEIGCFPVAISLPYH